MKEGKKKTEKGEERIKKHTQSLGETQNKTHKEQEKGEGK